MMSYKAPDIAVKKLWVHLLAHNLIRMIMAKSMLLAVFSLRELSFKHTLQLFLAMWQYGADEQGDRVQDLLALITGKRLENRPRRIEYCAMKQSPKPYPMLMQTRSAARAEVKRNGHPKKFK
ncbi:hypothetical protein [Pseudomonas sp. D2002]|uniref:hypothetical protein n=1 Tax=Pseudomonas sp. D2002 TaxID=2726980 RepID=UPI0015A177DD|nr:hypothetical protein [Pseudomonas sp. D2002]NWA84243.1 hypothetical protein [Pseudomonas sp. D2002]